MALVLCMVCLSWTCLPLSALTPSPPLCRRPLPASRPKPCRLLAHREVPHACTDRSRSEPTPPIAMLPDRHPKSHVAAVLSRRPVPVGER